MIDGGTRLVSFLAQGADVSSVAWLVDEFTNVWETPYDVSIFHFFLEEVFGERRKREWERGNKEADYILF